MADVREDRSLTALGMGDLDDRPIFVQQRPFEDGAAVLSIYNSCEVRGFSPESEQAITSLMGQRLLAVTMCSSCVELRFDGGCLLSVDVRDEAFIGPEAMVLHQPGKSPVVWT